MGVYGNFSLIENMITLRESLLFSSMTPTELERIVAVATEESYEQGDTIVIQGEKQWHLYIIKEGLVEVGVKQKSGIVTIFHSNF